MKNVDEMTFEEEQTYRASWKPTIHQAAILRAVRKHAQLHEQDEIGWDRLSDWSDFDIAKVLFSACLDEYPVGDVLDATVRMGRICEMKAQNSGLEWGMAQ